MLVNDFMENFVTQAAAVEEALQVAMSEINSVPLPVGIGPLRVSYEEISNIVQHACGYSFRKTDDMTPEEEKNHHIIAEGLEELREQMFLQQFAETMEEAMSAFHSDLVAIMRYNPLLMGDLRPIVAQLKVSAASALSKHKKFETVIEMVEAAQRRIEAAPEDVPNYVPRILDEIADFGECLLLPISEGSGIFPVAVNDNRPAA
jgi:hypothetical protein